MWHGVGWGDEEDDGEYQPEPLDLEGMDRASATARQMAMEQWYREKRSDPTELQRAPADLLKRVVPAT